MTPACAHCYRISLSMFMYADQQEEKLRKTMLTCPPLLKEILSDAQGRFMGVNNLAEEAERRVFADKLVCMMQVSVLLSCLQGILTKKKC